MRVAILLCACLLLMATDAWAQEDMPLVYDVENTGVDCPEAPLPSYRNLPEIEALPDPFTWSDVERGRLEQRWDWRCRRAEISTEIQYYELGDKPAPPPELEASYADGELAVVVTEGDDSITLTAQVNVPEGEGPFPAVIGVGSGTGSLPADIFSSRDVATIQYDVNDVATYGNGVGRVGPFYDLYPNGSSPLDSRGKFVAWAWGISRIIDGLEQVPELDIDLSRLAVTGCSYAGKISLFSGALDERIALTIAQEPGGGGAAAWRVTETLDDRRETLNNTNGSWYRSTFIPLFGNAVETLPYDHHELMAMVAPRALLILGNPGQIWLAEESGYVSSAVAQEVWTALQVPDRFGYSFVGGHGHCQLPSSQRPEVEAFVEKFLLGNEEADTDVAVTPFDSDLEQWRPWETPMLTGPPVSTEEVSTEDALGLRQNSPNPFTGHTTMAYSVQDAAHVTLAVYDAMGRRVHTLVDGFRPGGDYTVAWDGRDDAGRTLPSGTYFYRLSTPEADVTRVMAYVK